MSDRGPRFPRSKTRRRFLTTLSAASLLAWAPAARAAPPVELRARLSASEVAVGQRVQLTVEMTARGGNDAQIELELPDGFEAALISQQQASSGSSSFSFSFGSGGSGRVQRSRPAARGTSTETRVYLLVPTQPGEFDLSVYAVGPTGRIQATPAPRLKVTGQAQPVAPPPAAAGRGSEPVRARGDLFLHGSVQPEKVYVGQALSYALEIYDRKRQRQQFDLSERPSFKDFWSEDIERPLERRARLGSRIYRVHSVMARVLFPQKAGSLQIGGGRVTATPYGGFFFSGGPSVEIVGEPVTVEVLPLPAKGQPPGFRAHNVGRYEIAARVDRKRIRQGDALTLTLEIEGVGNVRLAEPDAWPELRGFRRSDPDAQAPRVRSDGGRVRGRRRWTFLLVAESAGALEIPAHAISFFDPKTERYETHRSEPIRVQVEPKAGYVVPGAEADASESTSAPDDDPLAPVVGGQRLPRVEAAEPWLTPARFDRGALGLVGVTSFGAMLRWGWNRWGPDEAARAKAARASWRAEHVAAMRAGAETGDGFWGSAAELLQDLALERLGAGHEGLTRVELAAALTAAGVGSRAVETWQGLLDRADAARFGAGLGGVDERSEALTQVETILKDEAWRARSATPTHQERRR